MGYIKYTTDDLSIILDYMEDNIKQINSMSNNSENKIKKFENFININKIYLAYLLLEIKLDFKNIKIKINDYKKNKKKLYVIYNQIIYNIDNKEDIDNKINKITELENDILYQYNILFINYNIFYKKYKNYKYKLNIIKIYECTDKLNMILMNLENINNKIKLINSELKKLYLERNYIANIINNTLNIN